MPSHKVTLSTLPPEVLTMILSQLTCHHLAVGVRVCKEWATVMNPILWETISIRTTMEFHRLKDSDYKAGLVRNGQWIRTLHLNYYSLVHDFASVLVKKDGANMVQQGDEIRLACANIQHLAVESECDPSRPQPLQPFPAFKEHVGSSLFGIASKGALTGPVPAAVPGSSLFGAAPVSGFGLSTTVPGFGFGAAPSVGFGAAPTGFGVAPTGFGVAPTGFGAAPAGFGAAPTGFGVAPTGFGIAPTGFGATSNGFVAAPSATDAETNLTDTSTVTPTPARPSLFGPDAAAPPSSTSLFSTVAPSASSSPSSTTAPVTAAPPSLFGASGTIYPAGAFLPYDGFVQGGARPLKPEDSPLPELDSRPLLELIRKNRTLVSLKLKGRLITGAKGNVILGQVLNSCRQSCEATFERLQLEFYVPYQCRQIEEVAEEVEKDAKDDGEDSKEEKKEKDEDGDMEGVEKRAVMSAFKTLSISGVVFDNSCLVHFLKGCPALESVCFWSMSDPNFMRFPPVLQKFCPQLKQLEMELSLEDSELAALLACNVDNPRQESWAVSEHGTKGDLRSSPASSLASWSGRGWRTVKIPWADESFGPFSLQALKLHYSTLESLQIEGCENFKSKDVQDLLCSSPRLKHLHAMTSGEICTPKNVVLDARDIAESTRKWACAETLLTLEVIINNIPRPDVLKNHNGRPLTDQPLHDSKIYSMQDSYELQRAVYAQLGEMTKLRVLVLGHDDTDAGNEMIDWEDFEDGYEEGDGTIVRGYQYECLSFTLESGMGLLKGLKDLWRLDLERMVVGLGGKEEEWIKENWPKWTSRWWEVQTLHMHGNGEYRY